MCLVPKEEGVESDGIEVMDGCEPLWRSWELNPGS